MSAFELSGNPLTLKQCRQVGGPTRALDPMRVHWLRGYFARFDAGLRMPQPQSTSLTRCIRSSFSMSRYTHERQLGEHFGDFTIRASIVREVTEGRLLND